MSFARAAGMLLLALAAMCFCSGAARAVGQPKYAITAIGTLAPDPSHLGAYVGSSVATDVNESGQVVGFATTADGVGSRAFLWQDGQITDLGDLGGKGSEAYGINDFGQVVGRSPGTDVSERRYAFLWQNGRMEALPSLGGYQSAAWEINNRGEIVGYSELPNRINHAALWSNGTAIDLGEPPSSIASGAEDINERGDVLGNANILWQPSGTEFSSWPITWRDGTMVVQRVEDSYNSYGRAINDLGQIVGTIWRSSWPTSDYRPFVWYGNQRTDLPTGAFLGGTATDINNESVVVGQVNRTLLEPSRQRAAVWIDGTFYDLNDCIPQDAGWVLQTATSVNERGQIVGWGYLNGQQRGFLLNHVFAPTNLRATAISSNEIDLVWQNNAPDANSISIERATSGSDFAPVADVAPTTSAFTDRGLQASTTYTYRVGVTVGSVTSDYSNTSAATTATPSPALTITGGRMVSDHVLRISTHQVLPADTKIVVAARFPVEVSDAINQQAVTAGVSDRTFDLDLRAAGVQRFQSNTHVIVSAQCMPAGFSAVNASYDLLIPLPVVTVHGIFPGDGGHFPVLEQTLMDLSRNDWTGALPYERFKESQYPTLFAFSWGSTQADTLDDGSRKLAAFIRDNVVANTWADKVYLVGHSRGSNLIRWFISTKWNSDPRTRLKYCAGTVLTCMPALGAAPLPLLRPHGLRRPSEVTPITAFDLLPLWRWTRTNTKQEFQASKNKDLEKLNNMDRPRDIPILVMYGTVGQLQNTTNTQTTFSLGSAFTYAAGDGWVTSYSARGMVIWPDRRNPTDVRLDRSKTIRWMQDLSPPPVEFPASQAYGGPGYFHGGFLTQPNVLSAIADWLKSRG